MSASSDLSFEFLSVIEGAICQDTAILKELASDKELGDKNSIDVQKPLETLSECKILVVPIRREKSILDIQIEYKHPPSHILKERRKKISHRRNVGSV